MSTLPARPINLPSCSILCSRSTMRRNSYMASWIFSVTPTWWTSPWMCTRTSSLTRKFHTVSLYFLVFRPSAAIWLMLSVHASLSHSRAFVEPRYSEWIESHRVPLGILSLFLKKENCLYSCCVAGRVGGFPFWAGSGIESDCSTSLFPVGVGTFANCVAHPAKALF